MAGMPWAGARPAGSRSIVVLTHARSGAPSRPATQSRRLRGLERHRLRWNRDFAPSICSLA
jgi:hypothetical protein